jgi:2,5-diamino-6-(ribosylamino)-4(3H)-pyrimidinone 5'-phosphate reductase
VTEFAPLQSPVPQYLAVRFPPPPAQRPHVIMNMVMSADGKAAAGETESALSSPADKLVLQSLRVHAGAILNGAGTARATGLNPSIGDTRLRRYRSEQLGMGSPPLQAVISGSGNIDSGARFLRQDNFRVAVFVGDGAEAAKVAELRSAGNDVHVIAQGRAGLAQLMQVLRAQYGVRLLLVEGGPSLNAELYHAGLIDEVFLTVGPHIEGGRDVLTTVTGDAFPPESMPALSLISAFANPASSEVYLHWSVDRLTQSGE